MIFVKKKIIVYNISKGSEKKMKLAIKIIALIIKELIVAITMGIVCLVNSFIEVCVNQTASTLEIQRLKHDTILAYSEFVINNQQFLHIICGLLLFLLSIVAILIFIKDAIKINNLIKHDEKKITKE